jgi:hypothetical protein
MNDSPNSLWCCFPEERIMNFNTFSSVTFVLLKCGTVLPYLLNILHSISYYFKNISLHGLAARKYLE